MRALCPLNRPKKTMNKEPGRFALVLHWHLPWVLHKDYWPHGESTLYEVIAFSYLPQIQVFARAAQAGLRGVAAISVTPVLLEQLCHPDTVIGFRQYLEDRITFTRECLVKTNEGDKRYTLIKFWNEIYKDLLRLWDEIEGNIPQILRKLCESGVIELLTAPSTHPFLPGLAFDASIRWHIQLGIDTFRKVFGFTPRGMWLPEMGYRPAGLWSGAHSKAAGPPRFRRGLEDWLDEAGIEYTIVNSHMIEGNRPPHEISLPVLSAALSRVHVPRPRLLRAPASLQRLHPYRPYLIGNSPHVSFFTRDPRSAAQVWARFTGYPGDPAYLEFHKIDSEAGLKLWRVTSHEAELHEKDWYNPKVAEERVREHARHFVALLEDTVEYARQFDPQNTPVIIAPYDGELFGHWWFEGPQWLLHVLHLLSTNPHVQASTPHSYLTLHPPDYGASLPAGTWGENGDDRVWINNNTIWLWDTLYNLEHRIYLVSSKFDLRQRSRQDAWNMLMVEWTLLSSSDWPFLITTGQAAQYARQRFQSHAQTLANLLDYVESGQEPSTPLPFSHWLLARRVTDACFTTGAPNATLFLTPEDEQVLENR